MHLANDVLTAEDRQLLQEFARRMESHLVDVTAEWVDTVERALMPPGADRDAYRQMLTFFIEASLRAYVQYIGAGDFEGMYEFQYQTNREGAAASLGSGAMPVYNPAEVHLTMRVASPVVSRWIDRLFPDDAERALRVKLAQERLGSQLGMILSEAYSAAREARLRELADELARALDTSKRLNRAKSEFVATVSHEIRSPLSSVVGYAEILRDGGFGPVNTEQYDILERLESIAKSTVQLTNDLVDHARTEAGVLPIHLQTVPLAPLLDELTETGRVMLGRRPVALELHHLPGAAAVRADPVRLRQVVNNLLTNAAKFTARGSITLTAAPASGSDRVEISVRDSGPGIRAEDLPHIFDLFYRAERQPAIGGSGIGLFLSRRLATMMNGELTVANLPAGGASFTLSLPSAPEA